MVLKLGASSGEITRGRAPAETNKMGLFFVGEKSERGRSIH